MQNRKQAMDHNHPRHCEERLQADEAISFSDKSSHNIRLLRRPEGTPRNDGLLNWFGICVFCLLVLTASLFAQENREPKIPPAFPADRPYSQPQEAHNELPTPVAVPPGKAAPIVSITANPDPPTASADWVLKRMATSENAELRKRASEAWPVTDAFMEDMNTLVYALADPDEKVRSTAVDRLHRLEAAQVFGYVMHTLVDGTLERVRALDGALPALEALLAPLMVETLRTELETPQHRRIAAYCLGRMRAFTAIETLGQYAASGDMTLSRACADALYAIGTAQTTPQWMMLLDHHDLYCRQIAASALAFLGGPNALERLQHLVLAEGEDLSLQTVALQGLSAQPPLLLFPLLLDILERNQQLRPMALRMLREQAGVDFGRDMAAWRNWLTALTTVKTPPIVPVE